MATDEGFDPFRGEGAAETVSNLPGSRIEFLGPSGLWKVTALAGTGAVTTFGCTAIEASELTLVSKAKVESGYFDRAPENLLW